MKLGTEWPVAPSQAEFRGFQDGLEGIALLHTSLRLRSPPHGDSGGPQRNAALSAGGGLRPGPCRRKEPREDLRIVTLFTLLASRLSELGHARTHSLGVGVSTWL